MTASAFCGVSRDQVTHDAPWPSGASQRTRVPSDSITAPASSG
jgi:hypothetical protein